MSNPFTEAFRTAGDDYECQKRWNAIKDDPVTFCRVANGRSNAEHVTVSNELLFAALCATPTPTKQIKAYTPGFAPCVLIDPAPLLPYIDADSIERYPKNLRNANVKLITLGVADFETTVDGFVPDVEHIVYPLDERKIAYVVKTSFSHGLPGKGPRFRVIFPLRAPIDVSDERAARGYVEAYHDLKEHWGWEHDVSCSNPGRFYYDGYRDAAGAEPLCIFKMGGRA